MQCCRVVRSSLAPSRPSESHPLSATSKGGTFSWLSVLAKQRSNLLHAVAINTNTMELCAFRSAS
eukprot:7027339-Alexandrium_andersonii.AAC.1